MSCNIRLMEVEFVPKILEAGILYVSERFNVAVHLCPCGCASKVVTPLGPCEWSLYKENEEPTLEPSIGNWQIPCKSHYWITNGKIEWSYPWTDEQIKTGRDREQAKRELYYQEKEASRQTSIWKRFKNWISKLWVR